MDTIVRYAVILHGPFVYSASYKPASVVVYLNLEGVTLQKPLKLMLKHWCKPVEGSSEAVLKLLRASHTTGEMENFRYIFHEVQGNSLHNTSTFTISEPQCLYCVEMKKEAQASYNAIAFQNNLPEDDLVKFRIQLMCNSLEWNTVSTCTALKVNWHSTVHVCGCCYVSMFSIWRKSWNNKDGRIATREVRFQNSFFVIRRSLLLPMNHKALVGKQPLMDTSL